MRLGGVSATALNAMLAIVLALLVAACSGGDYRGGETGDGADADALTMASEVFVGNPTRSEIKARLDRALSNAGMPLTEENYQRAGSALVALRQSKHDEGGCRSCTEMGILDYMLASHVDGVKMSFADLAAFSVTFLAAEEGL